MRPSQNVRHCTQKWPGEKYVSVRSVPLSSKSDPKLPDCRETETQKEREAGRQRQRDNSILFLFVVFIFYKDCSLG